MTDWSRLTAEELANTVRLELWNELPLESVCRDVRAALDELKKRAEAWEKPIKKSDLLWDYPGHPTRVKAERYKEAIWNAVNELGFPDDSYPAPIANAHDILLSALHEGENL